MGFEPVSKTMIYTTGPLYTNTYQMSFFKNPFWLITFFYNMLFKLINNAIFTFINENQMDWVTPECSLDNEEDWHIRAERHSFIGL